MTTPTSQALRGVRLGVSIAASSDEEGAPDLRELNRTVERLCRQMLALGAGLAFGHDWRPDGVMAQVLELARTYQRTGDTEPPLLNLVPWPMQPTLSTEEQDFLAGVLRVEQVGLPQALAAREAQLRAAPNGEAYLRARALTELRRRLTAHSTARICLGGKTRGYLSPLPGIVEEALLALEAGQPLYLSALQGGATRDVIDALSGAQAGAGGAAWQPAAGVREAFDRLPARFEPTAQPAPDPAAAWQRLAAVGVEGIARSNGLTADENRRLFRVRSVSEVIDWTIIGLTRLAAAGSFLTTSEPPASG